MEQIKNGLIGFILGDWLGVPYKGKGKGTFKPIWTKSYLRGDKCSGNTSMLLCALDSHCRLECYQQNLKDWSLKKKYIGDNIEYDMDVITQKAVQKNFRGVSSDSNSGYRSLVTCCVLALSSLSKDEILPFIKATHNCRYSFQYNWFFVEFIRCLLACGDKEQALQLAEQKCELQINRQNFCNGSFVIDAVESVINWFMEGKSYKKCIFLAINSGKECDAIGALTGFLAGLYYKIELTNGIRNFETIETYIDAFIKELEEKRI
ncbi:MAG: ADP-ribosylglycohydrolase family protein [Bacteroides sp.]|nr:ADP-ribosylglycohydrolase family protein [Bacteroides sp.]